MDENDVARAQIRVQANGRTNVKKLDKDAHIKKFRQHLDRLYDKKHEPWECSELIYSFNAGWKARGKAEKRRNKLGSSPHQARGGV